MVFVHFLHQHFHLGALHSDGGGGHQYPLFAIKVNGFFYRRFHADNGNVVTLPQCLYRYAGGCVAGDDNGFHMPRQHKLHHSLHVALDFLLGFLPVGHMHLICIVNKLFRGECPHRLIEHRQPSDSRIKNSDFHFLTISFPDIIS